MICNRLSRCIDNEINGINSSCSNRKICIKCADMRSNVKCEENRKIYNLENPDKLLIVLYLMDGGVIQEDALVPPNTHKCDYMFVITEEKRVVLTELKGVDVKHALEQINGTIDIYKDYFKMCEAVYGRVIVSSSTPKLNATPQYTKLQMKLKRLNGNLKIKENRYSESVKMLDKQN